MDPFSHCDTEERCTLARPLPHVLVLSIDICFLAQGIYHHGHTHARARTHIRMQIYICIITARKEKECLFNFRVYAHSAEEISMIASSLLAPFGDGLSFSDFSKLVCIY